MKSEQAEVINLDTIVTLGITLFFLYHLLIWAIGLRFVKVIGILIGTAFLYHIFNGSGGVDFTEWWLLIGILAGLATLKPKKKSKKAGKKASR